jgi:hypothetical protein
MRKRVVAIDCGTGRCVVGAFVPTADGELTLAQCASIPRDAAIPEPAWPKIPVTLRGAGACAAAPAANLTIFKAIAVPRVAPRKRAQIVRFEAEQAVPRPLAEVAWDWTASAADHGKVELAAMRFDTAEAFAAAAEKAGQRRDAIVPRAAALALAVRYNYPELGGPVALAEIDGATALLVLVGSGSCSVRLVGLPERALAVAGTENGDGGRELRLRRLAAEVERLCENPAETAERPVVRIFLLAGPDAPEPDELGSALGGDGWEVKRFDALRRVRLRPGAKVELASHELGVAVGTALALCGRPAPNLLPPARRKENAFRRRRATWLLSAGAAVAILAGIAVWLRCEVVRTHAEAQAIMRQLEPWRAAQCEAGELQRQLDVCRRELSVFDELGRARTCWARFLDDTQTRLARADGVWLETLRLLPAGADGGSGGSGALSGRAAAGQASGRVVRLRVALTGCALDPSLDGRRGLDRVRELLRGWVEAEAVAAVEAERFDTTEPGLLRFGCELVLKSEAGL